jgi:DNA-binding beta-propeller fold protein YncE
VSIGFLDTMRGGLTPAYNRGMETLTLTLGATAADGTTAIEAYNFAAYQKLYDDELPQSPRYLLVPQVSAADPVTIRFWFTRAPGLDEDSVDVVLPPGWPAQRTAAVPIPGNAADITNQLRLTRFQPQPPASQSAQDWQIVALLGNLAKLLWVIGAEHEELATQITGVTSQRNAASAHGSSLDLLGSDLGVPRFPPTAYTFDASALALYHLDDLPVPPATEVTTVLDDRSRYQPTSHSGQNNGGHSGRPGRFAGAFEFTESQTSISIPDGSDFALPPGAPFTIEAIIKPDPTATTTGAVIAKRSPLNTVAGVGWALTVGTFRGIDHNLRFSLSDGTNERELFADLDLGDGMFHHVAGVVDHRPGPPATTLGLVYVDGAECARLQLDPLGPLTSTRPILIGYGQESVPGSLTDAQYIGLVDEVRISNIARSSFNPVTGEGDDHYRRRLQVFQRWLLPTPVALQAALNELAGPVAGDANPFIVDEATDPLVMGTLSLRVLPAPLAPGHGIAADGNQRTTEAAAVGTVDDEPDFDVAWLCRHADQARLDFGQVESNRMMQWSVRQALDTLLNRPALAAGTLHVVKGYDPMATDLHSVGRALLLTHDILSAADLAVHAHAAGFGWVLNTGTGQVQAAQPRADIFRITPLEPDVMPQPPDLLEGQEIPLGIEPDQSAFADSQVRWSVIRTGAGAAFIRPATPANTLLLHGVAAGDVSVHVEVSRRNHTRSGTRNFRIGVVPENLVAGDSIGGDGQRGVTEEHAAGSPAADFSELYLQMRADDYLGQHDNVSYGTDLPDLSNRRVQRVTSAALDRLLDLVPPGSSGTLSVAKAYDPTATGLLTQGRALWLRHSSLSAEALAADTFAAGFDYIRIDPGPPETVQVAVGPGDQITVAAPTEVQVAQTVLASVDPSAQPSAVCFSADGGHAYVSARGSQRVTSFTLTASSTSALPQLTLDQSSPVSATPVAIAFADGNVYVAQEVPGTLSVLDAITLRAGPPITTGASPVAMAADGTTLFVGCAGDNTLRIYDTALNKQGASVVLPGAPRSIAPVPGRNSLYVVIDGDRFCQVDRTSLQFVEVSTGRGALSAVVTPDGQKLYVACAADDPANSTGTIRVYSTANNTQTSVISGFPPGTPPGMMAIGSDKPYLYVASSKSSSAAGSMTGPAAGQTICSATLAPGTYQVSWRLRYGGTASPAPDKNNMQLLLDTTVLAVAQVQPLMDTEQPMIPLAVNVPPGGGTLTIEAINAGSATAVYNAQFSAVTWGSGRVQIVSTATDALLPQIFAPGAETVWLATSPVAAAYQPCLLAASAETGTLTVGDPTPLGLTPPQPPAVVTVAALGSGVGEELGWSTTPFSRGQVALSSSVKPATQITGVAPGAALTRASYIRGSNLRPYEFEVRLNQKLEAQADVIITKDQYDLVMNILNFFHPLGVEVKTARLRAHVVELSELSADLFPGYTYPIYRNTGLTLPNPINPAAQRQP